MSVKKKSLQNVRGSLQGYLLKCLKRKLIRSLVSVSDAKTAEQLQRDHVETVSRTSRFGETDKNSSRSCVYLQCDANTQQTHTHAHSAWAGCCGSWLAGAKAGHEKPEQCHSSLSRKTTGEWQRDTDGEWLERERESASVHLCMHVDVCVHANVGSWGESLKRRLCLSTLWYGSGSHGNCVHSQGERRLN